MDYEKEIPFGVFDSELMHQEISIPKGFTATIEGNKIILTKTESEDEKIRKWIINEIKIKHHNLDEDNVDFVDKAIAWLENIPYTIDHEKREGFHLGYKAGLEKQGTSYTKRDVNDAYVEGMAFAKDELEKQSEQKSVIWSEEDKVKINRIVACLENLNVADNDILLKDVDWLKSLKQRIVWKPSDEQMKALHDLNLTGNISYAGQGQILIELYNDLKKLTE